MEIKSKNYYTNHYPYTTNIVIEIIIKYFQDINSKVLNTLLEISGKKFSSNHSLDAYSIYSPEFPQVQARTNIFTYKLIRYLSNNQNRT